MKKRTKSFILAFALSLAVGVCTSAGVMALAEDNPTVGMEAPLAETTKLGEVISIPAYYAQVGDKIVKATANVITPSGTVYAGSKFTATEGGRYIVEYTVDGKVVHTEDCLAVIGSTDLFKPNALASVDGIANYKYNPDDAFKGVAVNVQSGSTVLFDREIEMTSLTKDDVLFKATVEPSVQGEADFKQLVLTFTDTTDDAIYFKMGITDGYADGASAKHSPEAADRPVFRAADRPPLDWWITRTRESRAA